MAAYRYFSEGQLKVDPTTGTRCRTGQLNHQFVEQKFIDGTWVGIGDNDGVRYGDVAGAGCRFRDGLRDGDYVVDVELEVAGFLLAENDGWENIGGASGYWYPLKDSAFMAKVLFLGKVSEISGGQMPNKVIGSSDYLTVINATPGAESFQCPNPVAVSLGDEIVTNGTFDDATGWTLDNHWTVGSGKASCDAVSPAGGVHRQISLTVGKTYRVSFEITDYISGAVNYLQDYSTAGTARNSLGVFAQDFIYATGDIPGRQEITATTGFVGSIDNFSIKEVTIVDNDYILADTDHVWFNIDKSQRTVSTAELIGYDLQKTPVKYLDDSPNTLEEIVILKVGEVLTSGERNSLFRYMRLPVLWDNSLNITYGHLKSNRIGHNLWTVYGVNGELVQNGHFDADSIWTKGAGWTISGGKANCNLSANTSLSQVISTTSGKTYRVSFEISNCTTGGLTYVRIGWGAPNSKILITGNGIYTAILDLNLNASNELTFFGTTGDIFSIDNVSVKEVV